MSSREIRTNKVNSMIKPKPASSIRWAATLSRSNASDLETLAVSA